MAEKKVHNMVAADGSEKPAMQQAKPVGNAASLRIGAIVLWVVALILEILAILAVKNVIHITFIPTLWQLIIFLVLDLVCVIIGSQLWKKANRIDPASEKNKVKFWLWNNMGVIACVICFLPIIILLLTSKDLDKKTKTIAVVVAIIALLIGGVSSYDYDPISAEQKEAAEAVLGNETVYWTPYGKVYHTHEDCSALNHTDTLTYGTVEEAIAANRKDICKFCAKRDDITGIRTEGD